MLLLTTSAHPTTMRWRARCDGHGGQLLGRLLQPRSYDSARRTSAAGVPWAADNDAFQRFDVDAWERMIVAIKHVPGCLFVTVGDVVGDQGLTDLLWTEYAPVVYRYGHVPAYVLQEDGCEYDPLGVPWGSLGALFIGGAEDSFKLGESTALVVAEAKRRGKWVHMGRVNSHRRLRYAASIGCDSVDGTSWSRWRDRYLPSGLAVLQALTDHPPTRLEFA